MVSAPERPAGQSENTGASVAVGLGELHVLQTGELVAYSLGSCIAVCLHDPLARVSAMAHVVLPAAPPAGAGATPGKYADSAVPALLQAIERQGAARFRLKCKIAGGAAVLALGGGSLPNIGQRNAEAVRAALARAGLRLVAEDTGGKLGRTVRMNAGSGRVTVRTVFGAELEL